MVRSFSVMPTVKTITAPVYSKPSLSLLKTYNNDALASTIEPETLLEKLREFKLDGEVINIRRGPVITRYEIQLAKGVRLSDVRKLSEDIGMALMSGNIRIQAPIPGTSLVGIEVSNEKPATIGLKQILKAYKREEVIPLAIGVDTVGVPKIIDLTKMPHMLIAGQTGSGKSVCINSIILSILYTKDPSECQLILVDPKRVEMAAYKNVPHLRRAPITEAMDAPEAFEELVAEMDRRYKVLEDAGVRNIASYNERADIKMPYIVTVVDEMADLMMVAGKQLEKLIVRLAQLSRAVGIHLILATQRPVAEVITGLIKSNIPGKISFQVASQIDSRVILDHVGAEHLIGRGDMLMTCPGMSEPARFHGAWVSDKEIRDIVTRS
jgi:S-DNA-T family DNA segregation ATPase FtsK/SpoIIIE